MKWSAIDFDQNIIRICNNRVRIHREIEKKPKNRSSKADMPLIPIVREYLLELKEQQKKNQKLFGTKYQKNDYVCKHEDGTRFECNYINYKLSKILDENNMPHVTLHGLRHSTATMLASLGYSDIEIQSWLRHNDIKSTMRYTHDSLDLRKNASQAMNNIFTLG